uniref:Candidate secreted effector n=1 Tax=Meloidogyne incognita TaxID=6306 RepID=A0A914KUM8_MELIC
MLLLLLWYSRNTWRSRSTSTNWIGHKSNRTCHKTISTPIIILMTKLMHSTANTNLWSVLHTMVTLTLQNDLNFRHAVHHRLHESEHLHIFPTREKFVQANRSSSSNSCCNKYWCRSNSKTIQMTFTIHLFQIPMNCNTLITITLE